MIKAFIFDMDGTLLDSEILWVEAFKRVLQERGIHITDKEALSVVYGHSWTRVYETALRQYPGVLPGMEELGLIMRGHFNDLRQSRHVRIDGSIALLKRLAADYPVCIVSGSPRQDLDESIHIIGVERYLAFSLANEDYAAGKPDPDCFLKAAEMLNVTPAQCMVFEDSTAGIRAAKRAGMMCVALKRPGAPEQDISLADEVLSDLSEFRVKKYIR